MTESINKLKFENANLKNYNHYLQNMQGIYSKKYETLGSILADYLESLLLFKDRGGNNDSQLDGAAKEVSIDIKSLKDRDVKEWKI